jgi:hypothetical protein
MVKKIISVVLMLSAMIFLLGFIYMNFPQEPVEMILNTVLPKQTINITYNDTPVFMENLRFNHNNISYFIEEDCSKIRRDSMVEAFVIFENEMELISFYKIKNKSNADISVGCSDNYIELSDNLFIAGEGGPSRIINTSIFKMIEKGKISLYKDPRCDYPIVGLHELLHVFGFDHSKNPKSIMYNVSKCNQRITEDMIDLIDELYSIEPLADAFIENLTVIKKGRYLDFNVTVSNDGLIGVNSINLTIFAEGREFNVIELGELNIGYSRVLKVTNNKLPSKSVENIKFVLDVDDNIRELNEENNFMQMTISA